MGGFVVSAGLDGVDVSQFIVIATADVGIPLGVINDGHTKGRRDVGSKQHKKNRKNQFHFHHRLEGIAGTAPFSISSA